MRRENNERLVCSACASVYEMRRIDLKDARTLGQPWHCPKGHPQFPPTVAALKVATQLLVKETKRAEAAATEVGKLRRRLAGLLRLPKKEREKAKAIAVRDRQVVALQAKAKTAAGEIRLLREAARLTSRELRARESELRTHARDRATFLANKEASVAKAEKAAQIKGFQTGLALLFDDLLLRDCPFHSCKVSVASLSELLDHVRSQHLRP